MQDIDAKKQTPVTTYRFKNLGPVVDASLELGDLTIIAGHNNTGKTYLAYTLYGFLKMWKSGPFGRLMGNRLKRSSKQFPPFYEAAKTLIDEGIVRIPLDKENLAQQRQHISRYLARTFSARAISDIFSSTSENFNHASITVKLGERSSWKDMKIRGAGGMNLSTENDDLIIEMVSNKNFRKHHIERISSYISYNYNRFLFADEFPEPFILSAER